MDLKLLGSQLRGTVDEESRDEKLQPRRLRRKGSKLLPRWALICTILSITYKHGKLEIHTCRTQYPFNTKRPHGLITELPMGLDIDPTRMP